jgi:hypothetical protein
MNPYLNRFEVLSNDLGVTDDKLLGLAAAYSTKNNLWLSAAASSFGGTR